MSESSSTPPDSPTPFELIAILFVSHGAHQHILFKYPFPSPTQVKQQLNSQNAKRSSPYALASTDHLNFWIIEKEEKLISNGLLKGLETSILESIFMVNNKKNQPLELKVDNLFFLGSSNFIHHNNVQYNILFAVKSPLPKPVIACYQRLSLDIVNALMKEEANCGYLTEQLKLFNVDEQTSELMYEKILSNSQLAQEFKKIYEDIKNGIVNVTFNGRLNLSFCLPHLAYKIKEKLEQTHFVNVILNSKDYLKSYHAILLLMPKEDLIKALPAECCNKTKKLIVHSSPRNHLAFYKLVCDLDEEQLYVIVVHLIHWAKVKIIYPISAINVYVINPNTQIFVNNSLSQSFSEKFPGRSLPLTLEQFSIAKPLVEYMDSSQPKEAHQKLLDIVIWLLERNLLMQVHTYIYLVARRTKTNQFLKEISKSETSMDTNLDADLSGCGGGGGSEHSNDTDGCDYKDSVIFEKYRKILADRTELNEKDQQFVLRILHAKQEYERERRLFMKFLKYFDGTYNIEEIMFEEKVSRSEIFMVLETFKEILVTCVYEDPNPLLRINVRIA